MLLLLYLHFPDVLFLLNGMQLEIVERTTLFIENCRFNISQARA
jgi:hypothetical protein